MDTLSWTKINKLNKNIKFVASTKSFRGKLYRLQIFCPLAVALRRDNCSDDEIHDFVRYKKSTANRSRLLYLDQADSYQIINLRDNLKGIKFRVEGPLISVYFDTSSEVNSFITKIKSPFRNRIKEICGPINEKHAEDLKNNKIVKKSKIDYKYKLIFKDGLYKLETLKQICNYLDQAGAHFPPWRAKMIDEHAFEQKYIYGKYCYINNLDCLTFVDLIKPGAIKKYHELVTLEN